MHNLRSGNDIIPELDLVAEKEGRVVGQIAYTRGTLKTQQGEEIEILSFGPLSVLPEFQKQGIGGALIKHTIDLATAMKYPVICIYGDPRYYSRFGFRCAEKYDIKTSDDKYAVALLALELKKGALNGSAGRFIESPSYVVDENELAKYDAGFPFKEKAETASQQEFKLLVSLRY
jgi:predicted N-acetyltransferase YhbS